MIASAHLLACGILGVEALRADVTKGEGGRVGVEAVQVLGGGVLHGVVLRHKLVAHLQDQGSVWVGGCGVVVVVCVCVCVCVWRGGGGGGGY